MSDALDLELRSALAERAQSLPAAEAVERLQQVDYRPRRRPRRLRLWSAVGAASVSLLAGITTVVVLLSSDTTPALAGWTPVPSTPSASALAAATALCRAQGGPLFEKAVTGRLVLADQRGHYVSEVYASRIDTGVCIAADFGQTSEEGDATVLGFDAAPGPDQLGLPAGGGGTAPGFEGGAVELHLYGLAGKDITKVEFLFAGGSSVEATVENGWYFAWWPSQNEPRSVSVTTRSGSTIRSAMVGPDCRPDTKACSLFAGFRQHPARSGGTRTRR
jgi:hypothetical protein